MHESMKSNKNATHSINAERLHTLNRLDRIFKLNSKMVVRSGLWSTLELSNFFKISRINQLTGAFYKRKQWQTGRIVLVYLSFIFFKNTLIFGYLAQLSRYNTVNIQDRTKT